MGCEKLGQYMLKAKNFLQAIHYYERNFALANEANNEAWIRKAKVSLGFAKGESKMHAKLQ